MKHETFLQIQGSDFFEVTNIFPTLAQNFLKILLVNPRNFSTKHVNLQLAQTPMFDERCHEYVVKEGRWVEYHLFFMDPIYINLNEKQKL